MSNLPCPVDCECEECSFWRETTNDEPRQYQEDAGPECLMSDGEFAYYYERNGGF